MEIEAKKIDATFNCGLKKHYILFSAVVGFNTFFYRLYDLEVAE